MEEHGSTRYRYAGLSLCLFCLFSEILESEFVFFVYRKIS